MRAILPAGPDPMPNRALKFEVLLVESGKDWNRLRQIEGSKFRVELVDVVDSKVKRVALVDLLVGT